jgi:general transcriptional corepressor TUP1
VCGEDEGEAGGGKGTYGAGRCADSYVRSVCFSPDSKYLVAGAEDKTIKLWDIKGKRLRHSLHGHSKDIYSVDYSADGQYVVSGSGDKRAKLWDVNTGTCVRTFGDEDGPRDGVTSVAVSRDSRYIAAGSLDRVVRCPALFRAVPPRARGATDIGEGGAPHAARHTHTRKHTHAHTHRLWELKTGKLLEKFDGHNDSVYSVSFSPDAKLLASGSLDKTLKLWDLTNAGQANRTTSKCRHTFQGHKDFVLSVVFAPQGTWLISGSKVPSSARDPQPRTPNPEP